MKRLVSLLLAFVLVCSLAACGGEMTPDTNDGANPSQSESNINESSIDESNDGENKMDKGEISFSEIVAVDNDECSIKITEIDTDDLWFTLMVQLENKSANKNYAFSVESASINGVQCNPLFATEVAAGEKLNDEIEFLDEELKENSVGDYTDIELVFRVFDINDWEDIVAEETIHIYPYGEDKVAKFVREAQDSDNVLIDNEYVTVIVTGCEYDEIWGYSVNLFLMNKTDKNVEFSVDEASVNGVMPDTFFVSTVTAGKCAFDAVVWSNTALEENGITEIEEIKFNFRAYDEDDWSGNDFANETITLNP